MEVYAQHNPHVELLEDPYHHHLSDEIRQTDADKHIHRSVILDKLTTRLKSTRRDDTNFEGCCEGLDPLMFQEVLELVNNFGTSWEQVIQKYNMKQLNKFVNTLDTITGAIFNVKNLINGINAGPTTDTQHSSKPLLPIKKQMTTDKTANDNNGGFDPQMIVEVEELVQKFCASWEAIMTKYKVKSLTQFTSTLDTITEAILNVKELLNGMRAGVSEVAVEEQLLNDPEIFPQPPKLLPNPEILLSNDDEYNTLASDEQKYGFDENDELADDGDDIDESKSNESELNEHVTDDTIHVPLSPSITDSHLDPNQNPSYPSPDSSEKEYADDFVLIDDYERAIIDLNQKIKTLGKDLESSNI